MKISINEPCHENWDAMTPNQQGAFCGSCQKDVVDFSKMGLAQIKAFFSKPQSGKVCGRFEEKQLTELSFDDFFAKFRYWNFAKKFAIIFFLAFGFWIFSGSSAMAQSHHLKGEVEYVPEKPKPVKKDTVKKQIPAPVNNKKILMGKVKCVKPVVKEPEPMIMGGAVAFIEPEVIIESVITTINPIKDTTILNNIEQIVVQDSAFNPEIITPETIIKADTIAGVIERINDNTNQVVIYPNPSNGNFVLEIADSDETKQTAYILDASGKVVLTKKINGTATIDASSLKAGIYTISVIGSSTGIRINKRLVIVK